jgi:hypothetical protein
MEMNIRLAAAALFLSLSAFAHDEGHGPKLTDSPKQGGVISPVVKASEAKLGPKAVLIYKAELARLDDGTVRVYVYDQNMNPLPLTGFNKTAKGAVEMEKKKQTTKTPFELTLDGDSFSGKMPTITSRPYNVDVVMQEGDRRLLAAFDNLD